MSDARSVIEQNVSRETFLRLQTFHDLLCKWQKKINLIGDETVGDIWERHFLDSMQLADIIEKKNFFYADLGSGAGFPGLVLAILGYPMTLIESDARKVSFLREAARITETKVEILHLRIEQIKDRTFDVIMARATAPLRQLLFWTKDILDSKGTCFFLKGKNADQEIEVAKKKFTFDIKTAPSRTDANGCILIINNITQNR